jgi:hypothetical protein
VRDEHRELFDLEAQGLAPASVSRHLRIRALIVAALGLIGGLATAAVLLALVVDLVTVTANATAPAPPLVLGIDWPAVAVFVVVYAVVVAGLVALATRRSYRPS